MNTYIDKYRKYLINKNKSANTSNKYIAVINQVSKEQNINYWSLIGNESAIKFNFDQWLELPHKKYGTNKERNIAGKHYYSAPFSALRKCHG